MSTQEQNRPTLLPIRFLNQAVNAANRQYPLAHHGEIFEFYGPLNANYMVFTDSISETGTLPPVYRLKIVNGEWNLIVTL